MSIGSFIIGLIIVVAGAVSVKYNRQVADSFGSSAIAGKIGPGSKYDVFKFYSIIAILVGLIIMFGLYKPIIELIVSPFTKL